MHTELKESIRTLLEFYRELGFEKLPLQLPCGSAQSDAIKRGVPDGGVSAGMANSSFIPPGELHAHEDSRGKAARLLSLREEIGECQRCRLSKGRTKLVFGEGDPEARIMFIGEAPGREEDLQGRPFVGDAGELLTRLIEKMEFRREEVYIANIVKCRPPQNRDPQEDEMSSCFPFLERQIEIISPRVIVSLGKISSYTLLGIEGPLSKFSIMRTRGKFYEYKGIPLMPTFHPAYLLRNPRDKWLTWEDAQAVLKKLEALRRREE
ncbi:MAG: uracil-DNA glycosylase [Alphaproteobacteria bacterium]|uniref:Type-4 uracil-DNA glycosylase n=1 Tax=Candidatus Nitrobium versatile TaxID=2884831 RepID=A0A953JB16_9BACT|nr:uracil-DNA glycosylase [Candidatus Nitrobium versatile]